MTLNFRRAVIGDIPHMNPLIYASKASWGYPSEWLAQWRDELTVTPARLLDKHYWLAHNEGEDLVAVYAYIINPDNTVEVEDFWVSASQQKKGLGRRVFEHLTQQIANEGVSAFRLVADPNALSFYERMGGVVDGEYESTPPGRTLPTMIFEIM